MTSPLSFNSRLQIPPLPSLEIISLIAYFASFFFFREARGVVVRTPTYGAEGRGIEPRQRQNLCDWKTLSVHPAVSGYLIQFREGLKRQRKERDGLRLPYAVPWTR